MHIADPAPQAGVDVGTDAAEQPTISGDPETVENNMLDLCFIMDATGSMGQYISSATRNIHDISSTIAQSSKLASPEALRIGLIAYRDHPPQDRTYVTKNFGFTSSLPTVHANLSSLRAAGGGDGPEAVTAALRAALEDLEWRPNASKMAVLVADAPPHGIGERLDGFSNGDPDGHDPLQIVRRMSMMGITLFIVACEPALSSGYAHATDFYKALAELGSGLMLPLTDAGLLANVIIGSALEQMDMERLIEELGETVAARAAAGEDVDAVARDLHERMERRGVSTNHVAFEDIYVDTDDARHNRDVWTSSTSLAFGRRATRVAAPGARLTPAYVGGATHARTSPPAPSGGGARRTPTFGGFGGGGGLFGAATGSAGPPSTFGGFVSLGSATPPPAYSGPPPPPARSAAPAPPEPPAPGAAPRVGHTPSVVSPVSYHQVRRVARSVVSRSSPLADAAGRGE